MVFVFFFKQKTEYEMRISDWSSDVCSSDLLVAGHDGGSHRLRDGERAGRGGGKVGGAGHRNRLMAAGIAGGKGECGEQAERNGDAAPGQPFGLPLPRRRKCADLHPVTPSAPPDRKSVV